MLTHSSVLQTAKIFQATPVAVVTDKNRLVMTWKGKKIVDISRDFLNSNGASKHITVKAAAGCAEKAKRKRRIR